MQELKEYDTLSDGEIDVVLYMKRSGDPLTGISPEYKFHILLHQSLIAIGHINLRLGSSDKIIKYIGHIGYGIDASYRGHNYAKKACMIIRSVALQHGMKKLIITCNPTNYASRKTCENLGAKLIDIIEVPKTSDAYSKTEILKCRYEWEI